MRKPAFLLLSALIFVAVFALFPSNVTAGQDKVTLCHMTSTGEYVVIDIADPALPAHLEHGDAVIGDGWNADCEPDADNDGVADAVDNCPADANPDQANFDGDSEGDVCDPDDDDDGESDAEEIACGSDPLDAASMCPSGPSDYCMSVNGVVIEQRGSASCYSTDTTGDLPNTATATGAGAYAFAMFGDNNTATATGDDAVVYAIIGNNNIATAIGAGAYASASDGDNNTATATGDFAVAFASYGNNNTATATGKNASALAGAVALNGIPGNGNYNTATATGVYARAYALHGDNNIATAIGVDTRADALHGGCTAEAIGDSTSDYCP